MIKHFLISTIVLFTLNIESQSTSVLEVKYDFYLNLGVVSNQYQPVLIINKKESVFKWGKIMAVKEPDDSDFVINLNENDSIGTINYINLETDSILSREPWIHSEVYILKEKIPKIAWALTSESKTIGEFNCLKAIGLFRGRAYTAWYTLDIPVSMGPWKLQGLPGLIVQSEDEGKQIIFKIISITHIKMSEALKPNVNGTVISLEEYKIQQKSLVKDLFEKMSTKLPRGATIKITKTTDGMEIFDN
ncbi:MAG: GLPGLI family protein [Flavobacteriales bacterium]|nr:GLPGLI family protein [Flavobacteriales bacterium]